MRQKMAQGDWIKGNSKTLYKYVKSKRVPQVPKAHLCLVPRDVSCPEWILCINIHQREGWGEWKVWVCLKCVTSAYQERGSSRDIFVHYGGQIICLMKYISLMRGKGWNRWGSELVFQGNYQENQLRQRVDKVYTWNFEFFVVDGLVHKIRANGFLRCFGKLDPKLAWW